jgi:hypothetical protein
MFSVYDEKQAHDSSRGRDKHPALRPVGIPTPGPGSQVVCVRVDDLAGVRSGGATEDEENAVSEGDGDGDEEPASPKAKVSLVDFTCGDSLAKQDDDRGRVAFGLRVVRGGEEIRCPCPLKAHLRKGSDRQRESTETAGFTWAMSAKESVVLARWRSSFVA